MNAQTSIYVEVIVRLMQSRETDYGVRFPDQSETSSSGTDRTYDALIYTNLDIPFIEPQSDPPPGQRRIIADLPYVGKERVTVKWNRYQEFLAAFVEGEKAFYQMRERLLETLPPGLESLFTRPPTGQPIRLWLDTETPELDDLPWELMIYQSPSDAFARFTLVRGLPPENLSPIIPIGERLRLALIHQTQFTPPALLSALESIPEIEVISLTESPRKALEKVAKEGYEILHIVSDGEVSLGYEGILYFHGTDYDAPDSGQSSGESNRQQLLPTELSSILNSSRAAILCLTPQDYSNPDLMPIAKNRKVRSVFRAFTYLGGSKLPMPSVVAPLGPLKDEQTNLFWSEFYRGLAETLSLQQAMSRAQTGHLPYPVALFLRHFQQALFRRAEAKSVTPESDPVNLNAALQFSQELVSELSAHAEKYGELPDSVSEFVKTEEVRQRNLSEQLAPWLSEEDAK